MDTVYFTGRLTENEDAYAWHERAEYLLGAYCHVCGREPHTPMEILEEYLPGDMQSCQFVLCYEQLLDGIVEPHTVRDERDEAAMWDVPVIYFGRRRSWFGKLINRMGYYLCGFPIAFNTLDEAVAFIIKRTGQCPHEPKY